MQCEAVRVEPHLRPIADASGPEERLSALTFHTARLESNLLRRTGKPKRSLIHDLPFFQQAKSSSHPAPNFMKTTIFQLVGGPWDGQTLSTAAEDEANACFAQALLAMTGARVGSCIPLISPAAQQRIDAGVDPVQRQAVRPHTYEIVAADRRDAALFVTARHGAAQAAR